MSFYCWIINSYPLNAVGIQNAISKKKRHPDSDRKGANIQRLKFL